MKKKIRVFYRLTERDFHQATVWCHSWGWSGKCLNCYINSGAEHQQIVAKFAEAMSLEVLKEKAG